MLNGEDIFLIALAFAIGLFLGTSLGTSKFRRNADDYRMVEHGGRLFRVYDVTSLNYHLDAKEYQEATKLFRNKRGFQKMTSHG